MSMMSSTLPLDINGTVTFEMMNKGFSCVNTKILIDCSTQVTYYVAQDLYYSGITLQPPITILGYINGDLTCATYSADTTSISSNSTVGQILNIYGGCGPCVLPSTPTPTPTITNTPTITPTVSLTPNSTTTPTPSATPTITPTITITPTVTRTPNSTPPPSPSVTPTITNTPTQTTTPTTTITPTITNTPSVTPTITPTPNYVYVFKTCERVIKGISFSEVIQTLPVGFSITVGQTFKDSNGICWTFKGVFDTSYVTSDVNTSPFTWSGNYFVGLTPTIYSNCEVCLTPPPPPPPPPPGIELFVRTKYITTTPPGNLQYSINSGNNVNAGPVSTTSCEYQFTITGLQLGDSVDFSNTSTFSIAGSSSVCPDGPGGFGCNFTYDILSTGPQTVYLSIDGANSC